MLGLIGLVLAVVTIITLLWENWHLAIVSLLGSLIVIVFNGLDPTTVLDKNFMTSASSFVGSWFLLFLLGSIFGKLMGDSGASVAIARKFTQIIGKDRVILAIMITAFILSYGGIGTFIIAFSIYPVAVALFKDADIPRKLLPASFMVMPATVCMTMMPGTPTTQNIIPTKIFGTTVYAAPKMGIICSVVLALLAYFYLQHEVKKAAANGEHFVPSQKEKEMDLNEETSKNIPSVFASLLPIIILLVVMFALKNTLSALYAVSVAMTLAILTGGYLYRSKIKFKKIISDGTSGGLGTLIATSAIMGFGGVVQASPAFQTCINGLFSLNIGTMGSSVIAVYTITAITGSSTAGLTIFLNTMGNSLLSSGISTEMLHRIIDIASSPALPHSSGIVVANQIADTQQKDTYKYVFVTCVILPVLMCLLALVLGGIGII